MRRRIYYGWVLVGGLGLTELVSWGVLVYAFSVFVVPMRAELGWSLGALNAVYAVGIVASGAAAVPVGRWLQRHGARGLMTAGSLLTVGVLLAWSTVDSLLVFVGLFVLAGLAMAATLYEPAFAVTASWFDAKRPTAVLVLTIFGGAASLVFVPLTGQLVEGLGWRDALIVLAVIAGAVGLPIHGLVLRRWPSDLGLRPDGAMTDTASADGRSDPPPDEDLKPARAAILRSASFRWMTACLVLSTLGRISISVILVAYLVDRGYSLPVATLAAGGVGLFQVIGRVATTALSRFVAEHRAAGIVFVGQGLGLLLPLLSTGTSGSATALIAAFVVLFGLGFGLPELIRGSLVAAYYGPAHYPRVNAVLAVYVVAARAGGPFLAGLAVTAFGSYVPAFVGAAVCAFGTAYALARAHQARTNAANDG